MKDLDSIYDIARELPPEQRAAYLDRACEGNAALIDRVEEMIGKADVADALFGDTAESPNADADISLPSEKEGDGIGPYILRQRIGEGGFGVVWMAEQTRPISRMVALKVVKAGMDTREVLARFEAERQALAMMDHPNIAKVLDAGATASGGPYFAMELVKGAPITQFCDDQKFGVRRRLELFGEVCSAVNHAHQKGIIHRDLKPSNVMVTLHGDKPVPKVIDFGIAKATQGKLTDKTLFTRFEHFLGTPAYMSPEQAAMSGLDIDTRSDIYSLGVLLYELLVGQPPFDSKTLLSAGYDEMRRIIKEDEPIKPSTRLFQTRIGADSGKSPISPSALQGELDWIVMKAIDKDRARRYETANALAADIRRYLSDEPVEAAAPSAAYTLRKFARRHKPVFAAVAAVAITLVAGMVMSSWQAARARVAEKIARQERVAAMASSREATAAKAVAEEAMQTMEFERNTAERESYRATIRLAESMLQGDEQARYRAADVLWETRRELRGWEWGHLMAQCPLEEWSLRTHEEGLFIVQISPDGRFFATAGRPGTVILWEATTRKELWRRETGWVHQLAIDSRSRYLAIGTGDRALPQFDILDLATGNLVHQSSEAGKAQLAFSPSGADFYALCHDTLSRYGTEQWERVASVPVPGGDIPFVDADGAYVGVLNSYDSGGNPDRMRFAFLDPLTLQPAPQLDSLNLPSANTHSLAIPILRSAAGQILFSAVRTKVVSRSLDGVYEPAPAAGYEWKELAELQGTVTHLAHDPVSDTLIAATDQGNVKLIHSDGDGRTFSHGTAINGLSLFPDGRILTGGTDGLVKCWTVEASTDLSANLPLADGATGKYLAFANQGRRLLLQYWDAKLHVLFDLKTLKIQEFQRPDKRRNHSPQFPLIRPQTNELVVDDNTGLSFYRLGPEGLVTNETRFIPVSRPRCAAFDADGRHLIVSSGEKTVSVHDLATGKSLPAPSLLNVEALAINADGTRGAALCGEGIQVWDTATGRLLNRLDVPLRADYLRATPDFHPDGELLAVIDSENWRSTLIVWNTVLNRRERQIMSWPGTRFYRCYFSPDGNRLVVACSDSKVRLFDWRLGKELIALAGITMDPYNHPLAVSPDGLMIAYGGDSPSVRLAKALPWDVDSRHDETFRRAVEDLRVYSANTRR